MTLDEAKKIGEFVGITALDGADSVEALFVTYEPGARNGKFHKYKTVTLPRAVAVQLRDEQE